MRRDDLMRPVRAVARGTWWMWGLPVFSALAVFANTLSMDFLWDDVTFIVENHFIRNLANIPAFFLTGMPTLKTQLHYRPLGVVTLSIDWALWGRQSFGFHLTSVLLHGATTLAVFGLCSRLVGRKGAFWGSLLFAVHPVHCDAVAWISARGDLLAAFFYTMALIWYVDWRRNGGMPHLLMSVLAGSCALLSKEMAVTLPGAILLYELFLCGGEVRRRLRGPVLFGALLIPYFAARFAILVRPVGEHAPLDIRLFTSPGLFVEYLRLLVMPVNLKLLYHGWPLHTSFFSAGVILPFAVLSAVTLSLVPLSRRLPVAAFGLALIVVSLVPVSGLPAIIDVAPLAERYLYLPSVAFSLFMASVMDASPMRAGRLLACVALPVLLAMFVTTVLHNRHWTDEMTFLRRMVADAPGYHEAQAVYGWRLAQAGRLAEGESHVRKAISLKSDYMEAYNVLGGILIRQNRLDEAERLYEDILSRKPDQPEALCNAGIIMQRRGRFDAAAAMFYRAVELKPEFASAWYNLGLLNWEQGDPSAAAECFRRASEIDPGNPDFKADLASAIREMHAKDAKR